MVVKNSGIEDNFYDFSDDESLVLEEPEVDIESLPEPQPVEGFSNEEVPFEAEGPSVLDVQSMLIGKETEYTPPKEKFEVNIVPDLKSEFEAQEALKERETVEESPVFSYDQAPVDLEDDIVDYDDIINKNSTVPFVQRIIDPNRFPSNYIKPDGSTSPHRTSDEDLERPFLLRYTTDKDDLYVNGVKKFIVYPTNRYDKETKEFTKDEDPYTAVNQGEYILFDTEKEARDFATNWTSSATWKAGLRREEPLPLEYFADGAFIEQSKMTDPDAPMSFFEEEGSVDASVVSERPTAVFNGRKYFLDTGPSSNAKLNLLRQAVETVNYSDELEEELLLEAIAASIAEEALIEIDVDRPNNTKYADQIKKARGMFDAVRAQGKESLLGDFQDTYGDALVNTYEWAFSELPGESTGFFSTESRSTSPTAEQYAEMLALETLQGFDHDSKLKVLKYLDKYMDASEEFHPSDLFIQSENVTSLGGTIATQILQMPTGAVTIPISLAVAFRQGNRARNRNEITNDINNAVYTVAAKPSKP